MSVALALLIGLAPALVMWSVAPPQRRRARTWWVTGVVGAVSFSITPLEPWLAVVAIALLVWWFWQPDDYIGRMAGSELIPVLFSWLAIAATWFLVRSIPPETEGLIVAAWGVLGWAQAGLMLYERLYATDKRRSPHAGFGQRMYAGCFLALVCCLVPLWAWPGLLVGLFLSGPSWLALLALAAGSAVRWPAALPYLAALILVALGAFLVAPRGHVWGFRWLPRGDSLDSLRMRTRVVRLALRDLARDPAAWALGFGPGTAARASRRWNLRIPHVEALGNLHCEPVQICYEFGALGLLGLGLFAWRVAAGLTWGDPWSAAAVAAAVMACGGNISGIIPLGLTALIVWARVAP